MTIRIDTARLAVRIARRASEAFTVDNGFSWSEKGVLDSLPLETVHDYCRDACWEVCEEVGLDFDEWGLELTDEALNETGV